MERKLAACLSAFKYRKWTLFKIFVTVFLFFSGKISQRKMNGNLEISVDKLPVKRLDAIEETGAERFPPYVPSLKISFCFVSH